MNEQLAKTAERRRRLVRRFSFAGIAVVACYFIWQIVVAANIHSFPYDQNVNASVIGGADRPTSIFVSSAGINMASIIIVATILLVSTCGVITSRRKRT